MNDEERKRHSDEWNNWKPGSGRKGQSPFDKPREPMRDNAGRPVHSNGDINWTAWDAEIRSGKWRRRRRRRRP